MAEFFLSKIRVASQDFVEAGGRPVLERHQELRALLSERAGPEVAALFAEPLISRGNDAAPPSVSWYADEEGDARALTSLPVVERDRIETYLAEHLRPLRALADDPDSADLALGALSVYGREDVLVQNGRPVIVNWGLLPDGNGANAATRPTHYNATLGKYLALSGAQTVATPAVAPATPAVAAEPVIVPAPPSRARISPLAWVPLLVLLLIAGGVLAWLLTPGTRLFNAEIPPPVITDAQTLKAAEALNVSLRARRAALETALAGAVCRADGVLLLPDGRTPEGLLPPPLGVAPAQKAEAAPDALLPSPPARVLVPGENGEVSLLALIEASTVLILVATPDGVTTGSGFVVGPGLVVTNFHVIEDAVQTAGQEGAQIFVTNAALGKPRLASIEKTQGPLTQTGGDFALLRIEDADLPAFALHVPTGSLKLTNVIAAGFPGDVLAMDTSFAALKNGDAGAVPDLTVTDGTINTEQQMAPNTRLLMHSAPLSGGNSGGPLVDMCGRVVGMNTLVRKGPLQNRGFAQSAGDLAAFLNGTPASPSVTSEPCAPVVLSPQVAEAPVPKPDATPDQPAKD
jgi:Trypsin-like peptidase domain